MYGQKLLTLNPLSSCCLVGFYKHFLDLINKVSCSLCFDKKCRDHVLCNLSWREHLWLWLLLSMGSSVFMMLCTLSLYELCAKTFQILLYIYNKIKCGIFSEKMTSEKVLIQFWLQSSNFICFFLLLRILLSDYGFNENGIDQFCAIISVKFSIISLV